MAMGVSSGCINHPGIEAVARCKTCQKPVCSSCVVKGPTGNFCSPECKQKNEAFVNRAQKLDRMSSGSSLMGKLKKLIGTVAVVALVVCAASFVATYFGIEIPVLSGLIRSIMNR